MAYRHKSGQAAAAHDHYVRNKALIKRRSMRHKKITRQRIRDYVAGILARQACKDCGEADPIVLEFDHRDRNAKRFNIGDAVRDGWSLKAVVAEIAKCDVRCANCHRRKTFREQPEARPAAKADELPPLPLFECR